MSGFNFNGDSGVRAPWRFGNLNNTGNAGLAAANGNNTPSNANWNERPRLSAREGGGKRPPAAKPLLRG
jgi:hypothetical protein